MSLRSIACLLGILLVVQQAPESPKSFRVVSVGDPVGVGPQPSISCPAGAIPISPGVSIQSAITANPSGSSFCLKAGVHPILGSITPKTGTTITGEFGAVLDASGWQTTAVDAGVIRAMNEDIDDVTIRNVVIRNFPRTGILAFRDHSDRWTIDHVEVGPGYRGVTVPDDFVLSNSYVHHNTGDSGSGGYSCYLSTKGLFLNNEIAYNGPEQKCMHGNNVTWRGNYVHHNQGNGIWADGDNPGFLVENNVLEDNALYSIFFEVSTAGIIRNNTVRRAGWAGIMVATSRNVEVYGNTVDGWRGIGMFLFCGAVGGSWPATPNPEGVLPWDLRDVTIRDNVTTLGPQADAFVAQFSYTGCTEAQLLPYQNGSKNLRYVNNTYQVKDPAGRYWFWWNGLKTLAEWHALGHQ